ncbi:MAG: hypothetical protein VR64_06760 [Desulfatitalea sp. BRH_c12]|nr:MAG: hypothetical protein VR64_06760 [Desulfatitalea sp. BRH_c12]
MARIILTFNNKVLSNHHVAPGQQLTIGRHPNNHIVIDHLSVSAHHATVRQNGSELVLTDLGSRNGTFVNNEKAAETSLAHQDWITIGKHVCIVDLYETLSLEATENELMARSSAILDSDQTMFLEREEFESSWTGFDYLSFSGREDYELTGKAVTIGNNKNAAIKISGFWSLFAGRPSATIRKRHDEYVLEPAGGFLKPKINGTLVQGPTKLNHQDIIKVGPLEMQIRCVRRPSR